MKITESKVYTPACGIKLADIDLAFMINHILVVILPITAIIFSKFGQDDVGFRFLTLPPDA